ncbi:multidrug efflux SMR transporter [Cerasibacillus terrae]|uniref:Multidrug efflux SMR transporter n=1 Tax=Cerasibacillus terrae TaxID=2498845 RepID=A0A5C8NZL1_9BACI|nr:multidrug efflux SMR transporter [Cerasibacillus terrae]TXL66517.1 multidrug efflux SMR transporter [Cerasibacillus terrae]
MGWIFVLLAASAELVGVWGLNLFSQKRNLKNGILYFGGLGLSFALIYLSFKYLPVSIAYAVFTGLGTAGAVLINMFFFGDSKSWSRIGSLILIIAGVVGLKALS